MEGKKEILGFWIAPAEGAKFWLGVMTELKNRGVKDLFIASIDGLKSLSEAIETVFPEVKCIVHMIRNSIKYVNWEDRKEACKDIKEVYSKVMYTTNAIESINRSIRKVIKAKWAFPNDRAIFKILYLALNNASKEWTMPIKTEKPPLTFLQLNSKDGFRNG